MGDKNIIEKSNILNAMKPRKIGLLSDEMTLTELRFFCLYLSKLNARNINNRTVVISIDEFEKLFNIKTNSTILGDRIDNIMRRIMTIKEDNKIKKIMLYSKFEWVDVECPSEIEVTCNADVVPYLFELTSNYTSYRLINISKLNTVSKIRLYEVCKQYEKMKSKEFAIDELQELLMTRFELFKEFNRNILIPAMKDINEYTDINIKYEKILKCRKVYAIKFYISGKSTKSLSLTNEVETTDDMTSEQVQLFKPIYTEPRTLKDLYRKYFTDEQYEQLVVIIRSHGISNADVILKDALSALEEQMSQKKINSKIGYITNIVNNMVDDKLNPKSKKKIEPKKNQSYDIDEFERFAINDKEIKEAESAIFKDIMDAGFISADYETALKILKDNRLYMTLSEDKLQFIQSQMEGKKQAAEMMANI